MKRIFLLQIMAAFSLISPAQSWQDDEKAEKLDLSENLNYRIELQGSAADGKTPLWLNANRYGLSSLDDANGYVRGSMIRPLSTDSIRHWGVGYGLDLVGAMGYTSNVVVQQAFAELRWLHGAVTVGSKEYPMELKDNRLSSGSQTFGINARPVPQVRLALPDYWVIPRTGGWLRIKGHLAYGMTTDDAWQADFTGRQARHTEDVIYHSKAGYLKIGNEERYFPLSFEAGIEMACMFGGRSINAYGQVVEGATGFSSFLHSLYPSGYDATDGDFKNAEGNHLGSYVARINYDADTWSMAFYADQFFEDNSMAVHIAYNGWGEGEQAQQHVKHRYFIYDFNDWLLGGELKLKYGKWIDGLVLEYLTTKYQGGPTYHDHTANLAEHYTGLDNYYNHHLYTGWQHWGQVIGNPLYLSPLYNDDGQIVVKNNRFHALHMGLSGRPFPGLRYRLLATWQKGYGSYFNVYPDPRQNVSAMLETDYRFPDRSPLHGWSVRGALGIDNGKLLGNNVGAQLTIARQGLLFPDKKKQKGR